MDRISKFLQKLSKTERTTVDNIIMRVLNFDLDGLDVKKLKGEDAIFRVRKGKIRIIFVQRGNEIMILSIERRTDTTYKNLK